METAVTTTLGYYKIHEDAIEPEFSTSGSACFDLFAHLPTVYSHYPNGRTKDLERPHISVWNAENKKIERTYSQRWHGDDPVPSVTIEPKERALISTGLILDIPEGFSVRLHTRSSTSLKKGLIMPNGEGIIDSDYYHECFMMLLNVSDVPVHIKNGEKICQAELVKTFDFGLTETTIQPTQSTERVGGFGSTGV